MQPRPAWKRGGLPFGALAMFTLFLGACPGRLTDPERFTGANDGGGGGDCSSINVQADILVATCGVSGCHSAASKVNNLDTETPGLAKRMLNANAVGCPGQVLMKADITGYFFNKLTSAPTCGGQMPSLKPALTATETTCLKAFLAADLDGGST